MGRRRETDTVNDYDRSVVKFGDRTYETISEALSELIKRIKGKKKQN